MTKSSIGAVFLTIFLGGCSYDQAVDKYFPYPVPQDRPLAYQKKLQAAAHWDALAANEADEISHTLGTTSISFDVDKSDTDFGKAYKKMLTGHLLDKKIEVLNSGGIHLIKFQVQVVSHVNRDPLGLTSFLDQQANSDTEVLVTTELYHLGEIVESSTRIYYFNEGNELMYEPAPKRPDPNPDRLFKVTDQS